MRFCIKTLFDITETRARKGDDSTAMRQQQNYLTILNTIGLRVNPTYVDEPKTSIQKLKGFGDYEGEHCVWTYVFDIDFEGALDINTMQRDFDLIPIITGLTETVEIIPAVMRTSGDKTNIIIQEINTSV